jgi:hypothetical protein
LNRTLAAAPKPPEGERSYGSRHFLLVSVECELDVGKDRSMIIDMHWLTILAAMVVLIASGTLGDG